MSLEIKVPVVGESITEGVLVSWFKEEGESVQVDEALFELETDKITMTVPAEAAGRLSIRVPAGSKVAIGQVVGAIDPASASTAAGASTTAGAAAVAAAPPSDGPPISPPAGFPQVAAKLARPEDLSPAVRRLVDEHRLDPRQIPPSGKDGRLIKEDVLRYLESAPAVTPAPAPGAAAAAPAAAKALAPRLAAVPTPAPAPTPVRPPPAKAPASRPRPGPEAQAARQVRRPMSTLRQRVAERLVAAQQTAAILTTFNEADLSAVLALRERYKQPFEKRHDARLGFMSFFVKAAVDALKVVPTVNWQIQGDEIVENHYYDLGVAVSTEHGLVVPVVRDADRLSFAELEVEIGELARRARERTLQLSDLAGGTFTISNGGVYGSLMSTPILNPPQSGILGMHAIKKRPVVVGDEIVIRPMMYLALSYDHRLVDGEQAVTFLRRVVECIESPERLLLEV